MLGQNPTKVNAMDLLLEANEYTLIVKQNRKKIGSQHAGKWITITEGAEPIDKLLDILSASVSSFNPDAQKNKQKIKKWLANDLFHDELNDILKKML